MPLLLLGGIALSGAQSVESPSSQFKTLPSVFFGGTSSGSYAFATAGKQRPCESPFACNFDAGHSTAQHTCEFVSIAQELSVRAGISLQRL